MEEGREEGKEERKRGRRGEGTEGKRGILWLIEEDNLDLFDFEIRNMRKRFE